MPVTTVVQVAGELATAAWANGVRADLLALEDERFDLGPHNLRFVPGGNTDGGAGAFVTWVTMGSVTVPAVATAVIVNVHVTGFVATTTGAPQYHFRISLGTAEVNVPAIYQLKPTTTDRNDLSWASYISGPPTGSQSLLIQVSRTAGTGLIRADTGTVFSTDIQFRG